MHPFKNITNNYTMVKGKEGVTDYVTTRSRAKPVAKDDRRKKVEDVKIVNKKKIEGRSRSRRKINEESLVKEPQMRRSNLEESSPKVEKLTRRSERISSIMKENPPSAIKTSKQKRNIIKLSSDDLIPKDGSKTITTRNSRIKAKPEQIIKCDIQQVLKKTERTKSRPSLGKDTNIASKNECKVKNVIDATNENKKQSNKLKNKKQVLRKTRSSEGTTKKLKSLRVRKVKNYAVLADEDSPRVPIYNKITKTTKQTLNDDIYEFRDNKIKKDSDSDDYDQEMGSILRQIIKGEAKIAKGKNKKVNKKTKIVKKKMDDHKIEKQDEANRVIFNNNDGIDDKISNEPKVRTNIPQRDLKPRTKFRMPSINNDDRVMHATSNNNKEYDNSDDQISMCFGFDEDKTPKVKVLNNLLINKTQKELKARRRLQIKFQTDNDEEPEKSNHVDQISNCFGFDEEEHKTPKLQNRDNNSQIELESPWRTQIKFRSTPLKIHTNQSGLPTYDLELSSPLIKSAKTKTSTTSINTSKKLINTPSVKTCLKQNTILKYFNSSVHHENENLSYNESRIFDDHDLSPIKIQSTPARKVLGEINSSNLSFKELNLESDSSLFGFNRSEHVSNKNLPTRINFKEIKEIINKNVVEKVGNIEAAEDKSLDISEYNGPVVNLFEDCEPTQQNKPMVSYSRKRTRDAKKVHFEPHDDDVEENFNDSDEKRKRKQKLVHTPQEKRDYEEWIKKFNTMCEEVSKHKLNII